MSSKNAAMAGEAGKEPNKKGEKIIKKGEERGRGKGNRAAAEQVGPRPLFPGYP